VRRGDELVIARRDLFPFRAFTTGRDRQLRFMQARSLAGCARPRGKRRPASDCCASCPDEIWIPLISRTAAILRSLPFRSTSLAQPKRARVETERRGSPCRAQ
jgi:hypothetical protein